LLSPYPYKTHEFSPQYWTELTVFVRWQTVCTSTTYFCTCVLFKI